jgi:hypothetical protein
MRPPALQDFKGSASASLKFDTPRSDLEETVSVRFPADPCSGRFPLGGPSTMASRAALAHASDGYGVGTGNAFLER